MNLFEKSNHVGHCVLAGDTSCGSKLLYEYLCQHPTVLPAKRKEINYFIGRRIYTQEEYTIALNSTLERDVFHESGGESASHPRISGRPEDHPFMTIDGSTQYFRYPANIPQKLHNISPNSKIVFLFRNSIDRMYSNYQMNIERGHPKYIQKWPTFSKFLWTSGWKLDSINNYTENLKRWYQIFPQEQILVIKSEDLFENTQETLTKIFEFLDLVPHKIEPITPTPVTIHYSPMKIEERITLERYFEPINNKLYTLIGRDLNWVSQHHLDAPPVMRGFSECVPAGACLLPEVVPVRMKLRRPRPAQRVRKQAKK
uniref:Sulfotransferase domain protein n=1 Tax=Marseillevirus LCMAC201 TaxID=2506605 RepID=A0A481YXA8_9VIRU|nr:MAG: sulfotransferase domain protein [Marseillevirus LCMAC201]